jgi:hypothetical protein
MQTIHELIRAGDVTAIKSFMDEHRLRLDGNRIVPIDAESTKKIKGWAGFWNQRQQARKILLNSLYGALLNEGLRFYDERLGQSVTLTGRSIVRHMNGKTNEIITGSYDYTGDGIVYADTDSCYFSALSLENNDEWRQLLFTALAEKEIEDDVKENERIYGEFDFKNRSHMVRLYDDIADIVNSSFPDFMHDTFNTSFERGAIIAAGRELVASAGLFIKKKKYAVLMYDKEGSRKDTGNEPGQLKAMGLDLKRADTPKFMQRFLERILMDLLTNTTREDILGQIRQFREAFKDRPASEKGSPKKVSGLTAYGDKVNASTVTDIYSDAGGKVQLPGHVRASINWNRLCEANKDKYSTRITDGTRIVVCKLRPNSMKIDSIAYPIDEPHLPEWFLELPFDHSAMEETIIDNKIDNLLGVLDWNLNDSKTRAGEEFFDFSPRKK